MADIQKPNAECQLCSRRSNNPVKCPACGALYYCSERHRFKHKQHCHDEAECMRMAAQMLRTVVDAQRLTPCMLLERLGCHRRGLWCCECSCSPSLGAPDLPPARALGPSQTPDLAALCGLAASAVPCLRSSRSLHASVLGSWEQHYNARGLPLTSPIALLAHAPLTLLRALRWLSEQPAGMGVLDSGSCCTVHCVGAGKEARQWPVFLELGALLPRVHLHLVLIGPDVPRELNGRSALFDSPSASACGLAGCSCARAPAGMESGEASGSHAAGKEPDGATARGSMRLSFARGLYHEVEEGLARNLGAAHLVFGPNAGLAAYPSWLPTLRLLARPGAPAAAFTDFCEEAALRAADAAAACFGGGRNGARALPPPGDAAGSGAGCGTARAGGEPGSSARRVGSVHVNPFRQPRSCQGADNALPSYSNAFIFYVS